ncbi:MAG: hypothetical protein A3B34_04110 [Candidatus Sungbacteria bacterium RIFCSPLOWO2_01_FULL_54_21]|uniref:Uncharacterized protein n=1 Tax=Candidatus Sungbacteria bacterium RIFCSPLOWO2_01_FULL_54_21 TaxID=1802279 RepID=A0A1G2L914_9BACT|nr:MAG: hypothetical protein A2679_00820 [Candidatus Sungbacteria bacterium RIFCSPHIGHO2_01_FULL_54_26]OHA08133.1 MAG: hypothetical protein A3B34_04110 [Candidatus Sungbacteria bacterium RIFCSPLOWO2_01_FULL_54_21]
MNDFLAKIHALSEDARKILAGISVVVLGLGFFGVWSSFMSSRLVTLNAPAVPQEKPIGLTSPAVAHDASGSSPVARQEPVSPAAGIVGSIADAEKFFARSKSESMMGGIGTFFASIGTALAAVADAVYMKVAPWVPPYL